MSYAAPVPFGSVLDPGAGKDQEFLFPEAKAEGLRILLLGHSHGHAEMVHPFRPAT